MKNYSLALIHCFLAVCFSFAQEQATDKYNDAYQVIEVWLDAQRDYDRLPGITAMAMEDQQVLWTGAFGMANLEDGVESEVGTICSICSISKLFTSVSIMKLYDEGELRLDDPVGDLLPWYDLPQQYDDSGPITIRSLLTHSSGLPREADSPYWNPPYDFPSREEIQAKLTDQETLYPASTYFQYSNLGLTLLGEVVEEVSGQSYDEYVQQHILDPLGLTDTRTSLPQEMYGRELAVGYSVLQRDGTRIKLDQFQANGIKAAAGFSSNVTDLAKFAAWQYRLRDTTLTEILKPSTLRYMQRVHWTDPDWNTTWGLGFAVRKGPDGSTWIGHGGYCPGYQSSFLLHPKSKRAYSVMINAVGVNPMKYVTGIHSLLDKIPSKEVDREAADRLKDYVGYYSINNGELYVAAWGDQLASIRLPTENPGQSMTLYKYVEDNVFRRIRSDDSLGEAVLFERDPEGKVTRFRSHQIYYDKMD